MAKSPQDDRRKDSKLQSLLPSLTNEEIEEMYHNKIKLALDKSVTPNYQMKNLKEDIEILAAEMKARNMDMRARSPSRKSKILSLGPSNENYRTLMDIYKERKQRDGYAEVTEYKSRTKEPKSKFDSTTSGVYKAAEITSNNAELRPLSIGNKRLEEEKKNMAFSELTHMKKDLNLKLEAIDYYKPTDHRNEENELKQKQTDYNSSQGKEIDREQIHDRETNKQGKSLEYEEIDFVQSGEKENLYTLVVETAGHFKMIKTLYQNTIMENDSEFALVDEFLEKNINRKEKPVNDADNGKRKKAKDEGEEEEASNVSPRQRKV